MPGRELGPPAGLDAATLRARRLALGRSQREVARRAACCADTIRRLELDRGPVRASRWSAVAAVLRDGSCRGSLLP